MSTKANPRDENSEQADFRAFGVINANQLRLTDDPTNHTPSETSIAMTEPTRADLEAAMACARATIDGLRERVEILEDENERLREVGQ